MLEEAIFCLVGTVYLEPFGLELAGIPKTISISSDEIRQALAETVFQITNAIKRALDNTQELTDEFIGKLNTMQESKEKER